MDTDINASPLGCFFNVCVVLCRVGYYFCYVHNAGVNRALTDAKRSSPLCFFLLGPPKLSLRTLLKAFLASSSSLLIMIPPRWISLRRLLYFPPKTQTHTHTHTHTPPLSLSCSVLPTLRVSPGPPRVPSVDTPKTALPARGQWVGLRGLFRDAHNTPLLHPSGAQPLH